MRRSRTPRSWRTARLQKRWPARRRWLFLKLGRFKVGGVTNALLPGAIGEIAASYAGLPPGLTGAGLLASGVALAGAKRAVQAVSKQNALARNVAIARAASATGRARQDEIDALLGHKESDEQWCRDGRRRSKARRAGQPAEPKKKKPKGREFNLQPGNRPTRFAHRLAGGEFLSDICKSADMPDRRTVRRWVDQHPEFGKAYDRARELLADLHFEQILEIAGDGSGDIGSDGKVDWENVNRSRLRVDAIKWVVARLIPHKYAEKNVTQLSGPNDGPIEIATPVTDEQRIRVLQVMLAKHAIQNGHAPMRLIENARDTSWDEN